MIPKEVIDSAVENFKEQAKDTQPARYFCYRLGIEFAIGQLKPQFDAMQSEARTWKETARIMESKLHAETVHLKFVIDALIEQNRCLIIENNEILAENARLRAELKAG